MLVSLAAGLSLSVSATAQNVFPSTGNVGIGTTTPQAILDVAGHMVTRGSKTGYGIASPTGLSWGWYRREDVGGVNDDLKLLRYINGQFAEIAMQIQNSSGDIAIGTNSPRAKLDIHQSQTGSFLRLSRAGAPEEYLNVRGGPVPGIGTAFAFETRRWNGSGYDTLIPFYLDASGDVGMAGATLYAKYGGNVGIGTTSPQAKLDVAGQINCATLALTSDRNQKQDFRAVAAPEILTKVIGMPFTTWAYTNSPNVRHLGPMAQDFKAAFNLGEDDKHIGAGDGIGVALAAIKGLHEMVQEKDARIATLESRMANLEKQLTASIAVIERMNAQKPEKPSNLRVSGALQ